MCSCLELAQGVWKLVGNSGRCWSELRPYLAIHPYHLLLCSSQQKTKPAAPRYLRIHSKDHLPTEPSAAHHLVSCDFLWLTLHSSFPAQPSIPYRGDPSLTINHHPPNRAFPRRSLRRNCDIPNFHSPPPLSSTCRIIPDSSITAAAVVATAPLRLKVAMADLPRKDIHRHSRTTAVLREWTPNRCSSTTR